MEEIGRRILLVSPVRDEAETLQRTIDSVVAQTVQPVQWIIVDDGSTDGTAAIADRAADEHAWIRVHRRENRGHRSVGGGVIETFDAGLAVADAEHDFVGKLDGDLEFSPCYLARALEIFAADDQLAAVSGKVYYRVGDDFAPEFSMVDESVAGCFKLYRRGAFEAIGGFVRAVMWDGIDFHRARQAGYRTLSVEDEDLRIIHFRPMGSSDRNIYRGRMRWGRGQYFMGSTFAYVLASGVFRMREKPYVLGGVFIVAGFLIAALRGDERYESPGFREGLRRWQWQRLRSLVGLA